MQTNQDLARDFRNHLALAGGPAQSLDERSEQSEGVWSKGRVAQRISCRRDEEKFEESSTVSRRRGEDRTGTPLGLREPSREGHV